MQILYAVMETLTKHERDQIALKFISRYCILVNGKYKECNIIGWRTALAHARKYENPLYEPNLCIEILNNWTAEIITLEEAERRVRQVRNTGRQ